MIISATVCPLKVHIHITQVFLFIVYLFIIIFKTFWKRRSNFFIIILYLDKKCIIQAHFCASKLSR